MNRKVALVVGFLLSLPLHAAVQLQVLPATGPAGSTLPVPMGLQSDTAVTAFQVDISVNPALVTLTGTTEPAALTTHTADLAQIAPGIYRVVTYSVFNAAMPNGPVLNLLASISPLATNGPITITLSNPILSRPDATALTNVTLPPGALTVGVASVIRLSNVSLANGAFQFQVDGVTAASFTVESSTDLSTWKTVTTKPSSSGPTLFSTPASVADRPQFFRVKTQ